MEFHKKEIIVITICIVILALGLSFAGFFAGHGVYLSRVGDRYVTVKGLAERDVSADLAIWNIKMSATGNELQTVQARLDGDRETLLAFLKKQEIVDEEISQGRFSVTDLMAQEYRSERADQNRFILRYSLTVRSTDIAKVQKASGAIAELIRAGLVLDDDAGPNYLFTKLNDIKPELIAEATKNARRAAEQFAADSGSQVGNIRRASQGIISIEGRNGATQNFEEGQFSDSQLKSIDKKVRVVSTIDYSLMR